MPPIRPHPPDVMHFDRWPVRHPSLLFAGLALSRPDYVELWRRLEPDPTEEEVLRNFGEASLLLVPVLVDGEPIGAVEAIHRTPRRWNAADIAYAQGLASHLAPVLKRVGVARE